MMTTIEGEPWRVDDGFNLYVDVATACNARCPFCIAPTVGRRDGRGFVDSVEWALDLTERCNGTVQIVGGEPTISRRLPGLLDGIGRRRFRRVVLNTNGTGASEALMGRCHASRVTHINVSRHHYDEGRNQALMRFVRPFGNAALARALSVFSGVSVRLQCNIVRGFIDSFDEVRRFIEWASTLGVAGVSFSQTFPLSLFDYQRPPVAGFTEGAQVDLRELVTALDASPAFARAASEGAFPSRWGSSNWGRGYLYGGKRRFWRTGGLLLSLKTLSGFDVATGLPNTTEYSADTDPELAPGYLAFAVVHPDGRVTAGWDRRQRVLHDPSFATVPEWNPMSIGVPLSLQCQA